MPKLVILEGVDSTGKSTLSKYLARELNACYFHASGHKTMHYSMNAHHMAMLHDIEVNLANGHNVVCDRHWPSEIAYAAILRPEAFKIYDVGKIFDRLVTMRPIYVHCHSDHGWDRYEQTHRDHCRESFHHLSREEYDMIRERYSAIFADILHISYSIEEHGLRREPILNQIHECK